MSQKKGFQPGDVIRFNGNPCESAYRDEEYAVQVCPVEAAKSNSPDDPLGVGRDSQKLCHCDEKWVLVKKAGAINTTNNSIINLIQKAKLALKGEPEKTFIKAGVMDSDENLTAEGQTLFLTYLLKEKAADFKAAVIDPILADKDAE